MASLFGKRQHKCANLFATICVVLYFTQEINGKDDYVDFLRKANDRLTVEALTAFAGNFNVINYCKACLY